MAFKDVMRGIGDVILNNKLVTFLSIALFAFIITTIVLATENNSNKDALASCQAELSAATATPAPTTTLSPSDGTTTTIEPSTTTTVEPPTTTSPETTASTQAPIPPPETIAHEGKLLMAVSNFRRDDRRR